MTSKRLRLAVDNGPVKSTKKIGRSTGPRPVTLHYSFGYTGHCKSVKNAIIAASRHLLNGQTKRVNIEVDGAIVADLDMSFNKVTIHWVRGWLEYGAEK